MIWFHETLERYRAGTVLGYRDRVTPWVSMPIGSDAEHRAALLDAQLAIAGVRCALNLLADGFVSAVQRPVIGLVLAELVRVERALRRMG